MAITVSTNWKILQVYPDLLAQTILGQHGTDQLYTSAQASPVQDSDDVTHVAGVNLNCIQRILIP